MLVTQRLMKSCLLLSISLSALHFIFLKIGSLVCLILYQMIAYQDIQWQTNLYFLKKKKKKNWRPEFRFEGCKLGPKWGFHHFCEFGSLIFLKIAYRDSLQQFLISSRGKTDGKKLGFKFGANEAKFGLRLDFLLFSQVWFISFPLNYLGWQPGTMSSY